MCTQNGLKLKIRSERILIHALELKLWHFEVFPYVCNVLWLCMLDCIGIESSCTMWLFTVVDIKITRVGGVYCEGDAGFFFFFC